MNNGVYEIWKEIGDTPREALERFRSEKEISPDTSVTFAGRLDPMAEGVMHILVGESVHQKDEYTKKDKEYVVEILVGFHTDTYDLLGLIDTPSNVIEKKLDHDDVKKYINTHVETFDQQYPPYSSKPVQGKPLFLWARENKLNEIIIPTHEVTIYSADIKSIEKSLDGKDLYHNIETKINLVKGDFRQSEIIHKWKESIDDNKEYSIIELTLKVSSGTYVRQYVHDMSAVLGIPLVVFSIVRTKIL